MKKKILLSSIMTIAICLCIIAGSTFALFTSTANMDITVTSGKVSVTAEAPQNSFKGTSLDVVATKDQNNVIHFTNGGTAELNGGILTVDRMTPGDFVEFTINGDNQSTVGIRYRYLIKLVNDSVLSSALTVTVDGVQCTLDADGKYFSTAWIELPYGTTDNIGSVTVKIGLDKTVGNTDANGNSYHDQTIELSVLLEAIQYNGFDANGNPLT